MRYVVWALRLVIFVVVLMFALKNTDPVSVKFWGDYVVPDLPLIVVMLAVFVVGAIFGLLLMVPAAMRRRREMVRMKRELDRLQAAVGGAPVNTTVLPPEAVAPMSPL
ncbi:LapA family protein [Schauerella aestuarii]|uniref:LapA family protein n=1 Tax=Schauerella aestuarii TaxID=2511204 RepID=UPI00136B5B1F|nr:LapA family protein [Achromobacter aestuarii]MYZ43215.1 LapA family protein [Achromobacter aestuarii]